MKKEINFTDNMENKESGNAIKKKILCKNESAIVCMLLLTNLDFSAITYPL